MDVLWYGLKVTIVGMVVVFVGLIILIGCVKVLNIVLGRNKEGDVTPLSDASGSLPRDTVRPIKAAMPEPQQVRYYVPGPKLTRRDDALYAVISGAVARTLEAEGVNPEGGFAIRSVTPVEALGPKLTLKDGALYAVITAAVASALEAEGISPDGGFAIRSVKAL